MIYLITWFIEIFEEGVDCGLSASTEIDGLGASFEEKFSW